SRAVSLPDAPGRRRRRAGGAPRLLPYPVPGAAGGLLQDAGVGELREHQRASRASVAVGEGMDSLELRVGERGVEENGQIVAGEELDEVLHRCGIALRLRRDMDG